MARRQDTGKSPETGASKAEAGVDMGHEILHYGPHGLSPYWPVHTVDTTTILDQ